MQTRLSRIENCWAVPERLDRDDEAWAIGNRVKHRAVPFAEDGASLPCCHVGHSRHGYCAVQHMAMNLVAASTKKARVRMAVMPEPSASRPIPFIRFRVIRSHDCRRWHYSAGLVADILLMTCLTPASAAISSSALSKAPSFHIQRLISPEPMAPIGRCAMPPEFLGDVTRHSKSDPLCLTRWHTAPMLQCSIVEYNRIPGWNAVSCFSKETTHASGTSQTQHLN